MSSGAQKSSGDLCEDLSVYIREVEGLALLHVITPRPNQMSIFWVCRGSLG